MEFRGAAIFRSCPAITLRAEELSLKLLWPVLLEDANVVFAGELSDFVAHLEFEES
jgi:hypothetical protein